ncbi:MAG: diaminopimelate epimerase [Proteobacteria bacterium]|nr:diaminopimelate epimerase [Pseudomonadota bacterium]MBU4468834.1 diaminopimelate epimerase [Pseudomonadota bacterium]MCG2750827.1 diaminopimelate epimerase [Desulfobacteraceae bacterium]
MKFSKYHALGNDYIVIHPDDLEGLVLDEEKIIRICHRNFGVGSDGILLGPMPSSDCDFGLRIFNPDGSEAEKSGNGIRIFARYLWDLGLVKEARFTLSTPGGAVMAQLSKNAKSIRVDMGKVSFQSDQIPVKGPCREVINETIIIDGKQLVFCAATIGNPHCVIPCENLDPMEVRRLGAQLEVHDWFPNRINVQFMKVLDRNNIRIEIWERGAGYTLASGSSSSASAAVARKLGLCDDRITVHMPGGSLEIEIGEDYAITLTGPVTRVAKGEIFGEIFV